MIMYGMIWCVACAAGHLAFVNFHKSVVVTCISFAVVMLANVSPLCGWGGLLA